MSAKRKPFRDDFEDDLKQIADLSDDALESLMSAPGASAPAPRSAAESMESGDRVEGIVIGIQGEEVLVELDGKTLGVVDLAEFDDEDVKEPAVGDRLAAEFVRFDPEKDACVLSTHTVRTELTWDELRPGTVVEGLVTETNKGGLTLDIKGIRAFLPVSQIERQRVEDLEPYVGRKLTCEVTRVDRADENLVVSRRQVLDREHEAQREAAIEELSEGTQVRGTITRLTEHGAFIDVGGVDGLLHASKIDRASRRGGDEGKLHVGQHVEVEIVRVDPERGRVSLDLVEVEEDPMDEALATYQPGERVTGWIARFENGDAIVKLEEGVEAIVSASQVDSEWSEGAVIDAVVDRIEPAGKRLVLRPQASRGP